MTNDFWEQTYLKNAPWLLGVCCRYVSNRAEAEDLMHEAFLTAIHRFGTFNGLGSFEGWLRRITVNTALMHLRKKKRIPYGSLEELPEPDDTFPVDDKDESIKEIERADFSDEELFDAVNHLPSPYREVFNLYVIDNLTHKEIARILNITAGTSKSYLARARKKIQKSLLEVARQRNSLRDSDIPVQTETSDKFFYSKINLSYLLEFPDENKPEKFRIKKFTLRADRKDPIFLLFRKRLSFHSFPPYYRPKLNHSF
ncbi:MAG: RNA polymerase sigma factor [Bacteroidales bacterium]